MSTTTTPTSASASSRVLVIGLAGTVPEVEARLAALDRPVTVVGTLALDAAGGRVRDAIDAGLTEAVEAHRPDLVVVSLPATSSTLLAEVRTRLRRLGVPERYFPTSADLLDGVGPRTLPEIDPATLLDRPPRPVDRTRIEALIRGRRVLITGAGGSIGSELARMVAEFGPLELILMDRSERALFEIDRQIARRHPDLQRRASLQDVAEPAGTLRLFERTRPHIVLHAAAHKHVPLSEDHPAEAVRNNLLGSIHAVEAAIAVGASHFVQVSTDKAVAPRSVMGATKRLAELAVQRAAVDGGIRCAVVRFGNVLGSSGSVLDIWTREVREGGPLTVTDPRMTRYLMTIPEAAALVLQAATFADRAAPPGRVHVLDMGSPVRIIDLARRFAEAHGFTVIPDDAGASGRAGRLEIVHVGARPGEKLHEILVRPGRVLGDTEHPAIQTWDGRLPSRVRVNAAIAEAQSRPGTSSSAAAEAVRRAVWRVEGEGARVCRQEPDATNSRVPHREASIPGRG